MEKKQLKLNKSILLIVMNITLIVFSSCKNNRKGIQEDNINKTSKKEYHFYDFNFDVKIYREPIGILKEISYEDDFDDDRKGEYKVMYHNYFDDKNNIKLDKPLEEVFFVNKEKMDTIFKILSKRVSPKFLDNYSDVKIPPPPISSWEYCTIELDLLYRGDKYLVTTSNPSIFYDLLKLL